MLAKPQITAIALVSFVVIAAVSYGLVSQDEPEQTAEKQSAAKQSVAKQTVVIENEVVRSWSQFRGLNGQGDCSESVIPAQWDDDTNLVWKTRLVGRGASTPVIVDKNVFITAYTGFGLEPGEKAAKSDLRLHLICIDRESGQQKWVRTVKGSPAAQMPTENFLRHGSASSTPVCDGERVYAFFGASGVHAFDIDGKFLWQADVGSGTDNFGSSASPMLLDDILVVNASIESKRLFGLDKRTGQPTWIVDDVERSWTTPVIAKSKEGREELILNESYSVHGIDPKTGDKLWTCDGIQDYVVPLPVVDPSEDVVYCSGGKQSRMMAIRLGGSGDVTETHKLWESSLIGNVPTPLLHNGQLHIVGENGILQRFSTGDGKLKSKSRIKSKQKVFAGLVKSRDHLFVTMPGLGISVIDPKDDYKVVSTNQPDAEAADVLSAVSISGNKLFYRSDDWMYCVGFNSESPKVQKVTLDSGADQLVTPLTKHDLNPDSGRPKIYVRYMTGSMEDTAAIVLRPYDSVITPGEERETLTEMVTVKWDEYVSIRAQAKALVMKQNSIPAEEYVASFATIEEQMKALDRAIRRKVRASFTPEQMAQHNREHEAFVKAREARIKKLKEASR